MVLLRYEERHGYALLSELTAFGFAEGTLDPSLVYRALRNMEADGWLQSNWEEESQGPRRRTYKLTELGEEQLVYFIADLRRTRGEIDTLIQAYEKSNDKE
jgi:PadR family transcriptional regulator, regulatory protein PadR